MPLTRRRARTVLAEAYRAEGDDEAAELELRAAESAFIRLGAVPDAHHAAELAAARPQGAGNRVRARPG